MEKNDNYSKEGMMINLLVYNISNDLITGLLKSQKQVFSTYKQKMIELSRKIDKDYKHLSIEYWGTSSTFMGYDPFFLEKTGEDFNFWLNEINNIIFDLIERILSFIEEDTKKEDMRKLREFQDSLDDIINNLPSDYDIKRNFVQQGPQILDFGVKKKQVIGEWFVNVTNGMKRLDEIMLGLETLVNSITLLVNHQQKLAIRQSYLSGIRSNTEKVFLSVNLDMTRFFSYEIKIRKIVETRLKAMMKCSMFRFGNYLKCLQLVNKDIETMKGVLK